MSAGVRVRALAKINLDLRVLRRRSDGFHELRTVFQTISLADTLEIGFERARTAEIALDDGGLGIEDNIAARAARRAMEAMRVRGRVEIRLRKRIPMGAGLGGGSSDAAAVLMALPALAGRELSFQRKWEIARELGSDVAFFLVGGTAAAIGRGEELFPLPDGPRRSGLLIAPGIHVSTAQAYRDLSPRLSEESAARKVAEFQAGRRANDFEEVVFEQHPRLRALKRELLRAGAVEARMTGSGAAIFGFFDGAVPELRLKPDERTFRFSTVARARYNRFTSHLEVRR